ncbi:unnamed protein product [Timema podura]|uniref:RNA polymerase alpha subunit n=1 Tax=Timema podura TaxID=61482 RepID=A0ABN7NUQ9_TIMPD|nr:unnamed protein product [Timema podura]
MKHGVQVGARCHGKNSVTYDARDVKRVRGDRTQMDQCTVHLFYVGPIGSSEILNELDTPIKSEVVLKEELHDFEQLEFKPDSISFPPIREDVDTSPEVSSSYSRSLGLDIA